MKIFALHFTEVSTFDVRDEILRDEIHTRLKIKIKNAKGKKGSLTIMRV